LPGFFPNKMRICLYNSYVKKEEGDFDKTIWCPLSGDIVYIVHFFQKNNKENNLYIESVFRKYIPDEIQAVNADIIYFDTEKTEAEQREKLVAFYSQSDTLANSTLCIISGHPDYRYFNFIPSHKTENADIFFFEKNIPFHKYSFRSLKRLKPDILVLYNDWTKAAIRIIAQCHLLKIPVVCIQESILDFGDSFNRMQNADNVMIQGPKTSIELPRKHFYLTGNPRYSHSPHENISAEYVLINCNFTYNIYEEIRSEWLDDITTTLDELGINYLISQHPRDKGDLSKYRNYIKSSSSGLKQQIEKAGLVITRFSSLIHESLIEGVPVIYYNPHNERMKYDFDFNSEFLLLAKNKTALKEYSLSLYKKNISCEKLDFYLNSHCLPTETKPVSNINLILANNIFKTGKICFSDLLHLVFYHPVIVNFIQRIKKKLFKHSEHKN
jgi:hypothetical protein